MTDWPAGWREATLRAARIPISQFALDVLSAWRKSTPLISSTYNPVGMPSRGTNYPAYLGTAYALFPSITAFASTFARFCQLNKATELVHALSAGESYSDAWRAIHALKWPANSTETDYPSVLLDMIETVYRNKIATRTVAQRKTAGTIPAPAEVHAAVKMQANTLHYAAATLGNTTEAIRHIVKGLQ